MNYEVHHGGNSLNNVANLHLIMAITTANILRYCCRTRSKNTAVKDIEVDGNGMVHAHTGPGLGAEIDFELIERNKVVEL